MYKCDVCKGIFEDDVIIRKESGAITCPNWECKSEIIKHVSIGELTKDEQSSIV